MFAQQCLLEKTTLSYKMVSLESFERVTENYKIHPDMTDVKALPELLHGDQIRLKQILINLTKNALKFTKHGTIHILTAFDRVGQLLKVQIIDSGKGIAEAEMKSLFTMFGKLERTADINQEGIGMGLWIVKKLVQGCLGTLNIKSQGVNTGASFIFTMRMTKNEQTVHQNSMQKIPLKDSQPWDSRISRMEEAEEEDGLSWIRSD